MAVLEPVVVDEACETRAPVAEGQGWEELREGALDEGVGEDEGGEATYEE